MSVDKNMIPWRLFVPIVFLIGASLSVWGSASFTRSSENLWQEKIRLITAKQLSSVHSRWAELDGVMHSLQDVVADEKGVGLNSFNAVSKSALKRFESLDSMALYALDRASRPLLSRGKEVVLADNFWLKHKEIWRNRGVPENLTLVKAQKNSSLALFPLRYQNELYAVVLSFSLEGFMNNAWADPVLKGMALGYQVEGSNNITAVYRKTLKDQKAFDYKQKVFVGGHPIDFIWQINDSLLGGVDRMMGHLILAFGLIFSAAAALFVALQQRLADHIRQRVIERTEELELAGRKNKLLINNAFDMIAILDLSGKVQYANAAFNRTLFYARDRMKGTDFKEYVHPEDRHLVEKSLSELAQNHPFEETMFRMKNERGGWVYVKSVAKALFDKGFQELDSIVIHLHDVTEQLKFQQEISASNERFKDFADSSSDWLWEIDDKFNFSYVSPGITGVLGYSPNEMIGEPFAAMFTQNGEDEGTKVLIETLLERRQPYRDIEFWTHSKQGKAVCVRISGVPVQDVDGHFIGFRGAASNQTASKIDRENVQKLATTDQLTGLYNRHRFQEELERTLALAQRHDDYGVLLLIDLDRFKNINDTYGHEAGDIYLKAVAEVFKITLRTTDVISRLGGDEFAIIMHNLTPKQAQKKVKELIDNINDLRVSYRGAILQASMSVGMVSYPLEGKDSSSIVTAADLAMYRAKEMGRNRVFVDDSGDISAGAQEARLQLEWLDRLRDSLNNDDFEVFFQPMIPTHVEDMPIYESLIRVRDERGKIGEPSLFIKAAEHYGIVQQLDRQVIQRVIKHLSELKEQRGLEATASINISGMSLGVPEILVSLREGLRKYKNVNPNKIIIEVTETAAVRSMEEAQSFVNELKEIGCNFALDDFGVGFSSFSYIKHLDIDYLKLDGSYIQHLDKSREDQLFVQSLVSLAKGLGIKTIAEFVETKEVMDLLKDFGVDYIQGYYISKAQPDLPDVCGRFNTKKAMDFA